MSSKTLKAAVKAIQRLYPVELADRSWDNVGLLVDSSAGVGGSSSKTHFKILLTVDLTRKVAIEAVEKKIDLILAYHPFIFRGLKSVGSGLDPQQVSLIQLIKNNISVYSPHTSIDAAKGGVNDWLVDTLGSPISAKETIEKDSIDPEAGMGRFVTFLSPVDLEILVKEIKKNLGLQNIQLARAEPFGDKTDPSKVSLVAICAGSGGSIFSKYLKGGVVPDLIYTGELSHHEVLAFKERGANVILCNHSNTERGYLKHVETKLSNELGDQFAVEISETDSDPLIVV